MRRIPQFNDKHISFQVYSVVNGIANVNILSNGASVTDQLIEKGFGEFCEENFLSKVSNETHAIFICFRWLKSNNFLIL